MTTATTELDLLVQMAENNVTAAKTHKDSASNTRALQNALSEWVHAETQLAIFRAAQEGKATVEVRKHLDGRGTCTDAMLRAEESIRQDAAWSALRFVREYVDADGVLFG